MVAPDIRHYLDNPSFRVSQYPPNMGCIRILEYMRCISRYTRVYLLLDILESEVLCEVLGHTTRFMLAPPVPSSGLRCARR